MGLFSFVGKLFGGGHSGAKDAYRSQERALKEQKKLNREIAAFNKSVIQKTFPEQKLAIKLQLRNMLGQQMASLMASSSAPGSASPYFILGETQAMGNKQLQELNFNYQVAMKNEDFRSRSVLNTLDSQISNTKYMIKAERAQERASILGNIIGLGGAAWGLWKSSSLFGSPGGIASSLAGVVRQVS